jgi:hypothetical protein
VAPESEGEDSLAVHGSIVSQNLRNLDPFGPTDETVGWSSAPVSSITAAGLPVRSIAMMTVAFFID